MQANIQVDEFDTDQKSDALGQSAASLPADAHVHESRPGCAAAADNSFMLETADSGALHDRGCTRSRASRMVLLQICPADEKLHAWHHAWVCMSCLCD